MSRRRRRRESSTSRRWRRSRAARRRRSSGGSVRRSGRRPRRRSWCWRRNITHGEDEIEVEGSHRPDEFCFPICTNVAFQDECACRSVGQLPRRPPLCLPVVGDTFHGCGIGEALKQTPVYLIDLSESYGWIYPQEHIAFVDDAVIFIAQMLDEVIARACISIEPPRRGG